jgi:hypothetical protein
MSQTLKSTYAIIIAGVFLLTAFLPVVPLGAQPAGEQTVTGNGFRISPVTSEFIIEPGQTEIMNITIENPTSAPLTAVAIVNDFVAGENEDGEVRPILNEDAPAPRNSFKSLVSPIDRIELEPRERVELEVPISVPEDANAGGYYGIVRFEPAELRDAGNVTLSASVGSIALVRVPGDLTERLDLVQISAAQDNSLRSFLTGGDVSVLIRLRNSGDIHLQPHGLVQIKNMFGDVVASYELNDSSPRAYILPDTIRRFQDDLEERNWFGRYTIEANIGNMQSGGEPLNARATFWYIPAWALVALFVALAAIAFGIISLVNRRSNKKKRK